MWRQEGRNFDFRILVFTVWAQMAEVGKEWVRDMGFRIKIERRARSRFPEELYDRQARLAAILLELGMTASSDNYQCAVFQLDTQNSLFTERTCIQGNASVHVPFVVMDPPMLQN